MNRLVVAPAFWVFLELASANVKEEVKRVIHKKGQKMRWGLFVVLITTLLAVGCATTKFPGNSRADSLLQRDTAKVVLIFEEAFHPGCKQSKIVNTEVAVDPGNDSPGAWTERWTVESCGKLSYYKIVFTPAQGGGTHFGVSVWGESAYLDEKDKSTNRSGGPNTDLATLASKGTLDEVERAIKNGADVNDDGGTGVTPLIQAARDNPNPGVISALVRAGAEVNARGRDGLTALMLAAAYNSNPQVITTLLKAGADPKAQGRDGGTALMYAARVNQNPEVITVLLKADADIEASNESGATALMYAAGHNQNPEVISTLLKAGADPNTQAKNGATAMMAAAGYNQNPEVISTLLKAGADPKAQDKYGETVLMYAAALNQNPEVVSKLLESGADLNTQNKRGWTALMVAARGNLNPEVIVLLLKAGADARAKDSEGKTAFDYAQDNEHLKGTGAYWKLNDARY